MDSGLTASEVALLNDKGNNGWGDNSMMWMFALLLLFGGGNFGFNRGGNPVTEADLCSANSFQELKNMTSRMNDNLGKGICDLGYETARQFGDVEKQLSECCCGIKFDMANYNAATNANVTAQTQKILDAISGNRMADMQNQINSLQLQAALCGVPKVNPYGYGICPQFCQPTCGGCY